MSRSGSLLSGARAWGSRPSHITSTAPKPLPTPGRARGQQQVALAILDRVLNPGIIPTLVTRAPTLYAELQSGIRTNMNLDQMIQLGWLAVQLPQESYHRGVIGPPGMVCFYTLPDGAAVLRPVADQIRALRDQIFTQTSSFGPDVPAP